jgi:hypothetical protein
MRKYSVDTTTECFLYLQSGNSIYTQWQERLYFVIRLYRLNASGAVQAIFASFLNLANDCRTEKTKLVCCRLCLISSSRHNLFFINGKLLYREIQKISNHSINLKLFSMAESKNNVVTFGLSGKVGDILIFRQKKGRTIVAKIPEQPKKMSGKQIAQQRRFKNGVIYATGATVAPETKAIYDSIAEKKERTPFNIAVADFLNVPEIETIDLSNYTGAPGDTIKVTAFDDVMVKTVHISIINADGTLVEEGEAVADASGTVWTYTALQCNDNLDGDKIVVSVADLPGNVVEESVTTS